MDARNYSKVCKTAFPALEQLVSMSKGSWDKVTVAHLTRDMLVDGYQADVVAHAQPALWNLLADFIFSQASHHYLGYFDYLLHSLKQTADKNSWAVLETELCAYLKGGGFEFKAVLAQLLVVNTLIQSKDFRLLSIIFTDETDPFRSVTFWDLDTGKTVIVEVWTKDYCAHPPGMPMQFEDDLSNDVCEFFIAKASAVEDFLQQIIAPVLWLPQSSDLKNATLPNWTAFPGISVLPIQSITRFKNSNGHYIYRSGYIK